MNTKESKELQKLCTKGQRFQEISNGVTISSRKPPPETNQITVQQIVLLIVPIFSYHQMCDYYIPPIMSTSNKTEQCTKYLKNACLPNFATQTKGQRPFPVAPILKNEAPQFKHNATM